MTILIDTRSVVDPLAGGVTRVARGLIPALCTSMPNDTFILATTGSRRPILPFTLPLNARHEHISLPNKLWTFGSMVGAFSLTYWFRKHKPDHLFLPNLGFVGRPTIPYSLLVHDLSFLIEPRWFSRKSRLWHKAVNATRITQRASHLFAVSETTKTDLQKYLNIDPMRISVIPMGLSGPGALLPLPPILSNRRYVLCLGANDPRKNASCAIAAMEQLHEDPEFKDVVLVMIGKIRKFENSKIRNVIFLRRPSDAALNTLYKFASAFLYPSWYEGFGLPLHEAAQFNTPCIASTTSCLPETAPKGTIFAPPTKPHLWTMALKEVLTRSETHKTQTFLQDWKGSAIVLASHFREL